MPLYVFKLSNPPAGNPYLVAAYPNSGETVDGQSGAYLGAGQGLRESISPLSPLRLSLLMQAHLHSITLPANRPILRLGPHQPLHTRFVHLMNSRAGP